MLAARCLRWCLLIDSSWRAFCHMGLTHSLYNAHTWPALPSFLETAADRTSRSQTPTFPSVSFLLNSLFFPPLDKKSSPPFLLPPLLLIFHLLPSNHFHLSSSSSSLRHFAPYSLHLSSAQSPPTFLSKSPLRFPGFCLSPVFLTRFLMCHIHRNLCRQLKSLLFPVNGLSLLEAVFFVSDSKKCKKKQWK